MNTQKTTVEHTGCEMRFWNNCVNATEASKHLLGRITPDRLTELADMKICPHIRIDDGEPLFHPPTIKEWVMVNLVTTCDGSSVPLVSITKVEISAAKAKSELVPSCLRNVSGLLVADLASHFSGIYFLCSGDDLVYVGKANDIASRAGSHSDKKYDRVYCIYAPKNRLFEIESSLIRELLPKYNACPVASKARNTDAMNALTF